MTKKGGWTKTGFGTILRQLREAEGISQKTLAERAECHERTITKLENGSHEPAWPLVLALCKALGVDVTVFVPTGKKIADSSKRPRGRPKKEVN